MIITINRSPDWALSTLPVGAVINLPASLADPLILAGQAVPTPGAAITHTDPFGPGGSSGGTGTGHIQTVYTTLAAAAAANTGVGIGTTVYIGTAPLNYIKYEVIAQPSSVVGNWQALKGTFAASIVNLNIVPGRGGANLSIHVDVGTEATVTVDGVVNPFPLIAADANGGDYVLNLFEKQGEAPPALVSILRTSGSGGGTYCLE